ncbi:MAG TPA: HAD family hydrolase [Actinobacteria bacterium]|nr:HAD family hydrolase [Actinomycetota bacterium]HDL49070.1 HAD family hydrolase [Actinomycetota bacterium]
MPSDARSSRCVRRVARWAPRVSTVHIVWDWNGTLLDDLTQVVDAVNVTLGEIGEPSITIREYGAHYQRPVRRFYESLLGRVVPDDEWRLIDDVFHVAYRDLLPKMRLAPDAIEALDGVRRAGHTQSLLSMLWHDDLVTMVERFDIGSFMNRVEGLRGERGARKQVFLEGHLQALGDSVDVGGVLMIGDALDDVEAAVAVGTRCVLYDRGTFPQERIRATGVATASTLVGALEVGGAI